MPYTYEFPRPAVTVDCLIYRIAGTDREILLIRRGSEPYKGMWALPGGFIGMDETLEQAAIRELKEETGLEFTHLEQFRTFDRVDRDPRHRTISIVFTGCTRQDWSTVTAASDAGEAGWFPLAHLPDLAFDHREIIRLALELHAI